MSAAEEESLVLVQAQEVGSAVDRMALAKERLLTGEELVAQRSNIRDTSEAMDRAFGEAGSLDPPYEPAVLVRLYGASNALRQNIDALVQNVHGGGHTFEPVLDLDADETWEQVRLAMAFERERQAELEAADGESPSPIVEPTEEEVDARVNSLKDQSRRELARLKAFFDFAVRESSFVRLRRQLGTDQETIGWGAFEVLRNARGEPKRLRYAPGWTLRALPRGRVPVEVRDMVRVTDITWEEAVESQAFRLFVQIYEGQSVYFKEYGDPRVVSSATGRVYEDVDHLHRVEPSSQPATELLWFALDNPESDVYGLIRWSGNILSVLGSREMEEVNLLFFDNKAIPPLMILVSGGHLAAQAKEELQQVIRDQIKGKRNFHRILVIEAEGATTAGQLSGLPGQQSVRVEVKPLTDAIMKDQMWSEYDKDNRHKVGQCFRVPPIIRGDTKDFNRSTAAAAIRYAEDQVFRPTRDDFDFEINRTIVRDLRVLLWRFRSQSTYRPDPAELLERVEGLTNAILTPAEARLIVAKALGADLAKVEAEWSKLPLRYALAGFDASPPETEAPAMPAPAPDEGEDLQEEEAEEAEELERAHQVPVDRVTISPEKFSRLFESQ